VKFSPRKHETSHKKELPRDGGALHGRKKEKERIRKKRLNST
jgi:hypothetical protein